MLVKDKSLIINNPSNTENEGKILSPTAEFFNSQTSQPIQVKEVKKFKTYSETQLTDDFEPFEFDWLIEDIFDKGRLHMIAGPQGSGKTRFFLRMIHDWSNGIPVLGKASTPAKFLYIDAARDTKSIKVALRSLNISPSDFHILDWNQLHTTNTFSDLQNMIPPEIEVVFIDNLAMMLQSETHSDPSSSYATVFKFLSKLKNWMIKTNRTVIFTHTFIKSEASHKYMSPRSKVYGAQAWLQSCETAILFDEENPSDLRDPYRTVDIILKNHKPLDLSRRFKLNPDGRLTIAPKLPNTPTPQTEEVKEHFLLLKYFPLPPETISAFTLAKKTNLAKTTLYRHLNKLLTLKIIDKQGKDFILLKSPDDIS